MKRSWTLLILVAMLAGTALVVARRSPHRAQASAPGITPPQVVGVSLQIEDGTLTPAETEAPLGSLLVFTLLNASSRSHVVALAGHEEALLPCTLQAGESRTDTLLLSLPGEDFAWMLDGEPAARLSVTGSHLVKGHR